MVIGFAFVLFKQQLLKQFVFLFMALYRQQSRKVKVTT